MILEIALRVFVLVVTSTFGNLRQMDDQETARPSGASDWFVEIAGVGFAGGLLGGLAGATLALAVVQFQPGVLGVFPIEWNDWLGSYVCIVPLGWLIVGPLGSAAADLMISVTRIRRNRIYLLAGGFALAAAVTAYLILVWPQYTNWI